MNTHALDTLAVAGKLKASGFTEAQAEALTLVLRDARGADIGTLAAKVDLAELRSGLKADLAELRSELKADLAELRSELTEFKLSTKAEFAEVRSEIRQLELRLEAKIEAGKAETIKWIVSAIGFQTIVVVGAILGVVRFTQP